MLRNLFLFLFLMACVRFSIALAIAKTCGFEGSLWWEDHGGTDQLPAGELTQRLRACFPEVLSSIPATTQWLTPSIMRSGALPVCRQHWGGQKQVDLQQQVSDLPGLHRETLFQKKRFLFCLYLSVPCGSQRPEDIDPLELELQVVVSRHVGAKDRPDLLEEQPV